VTALKPCESSRRHGRETSFQVQRPWTMSRGRQGRLWPRRASPLLSPCPLKKPWGLFRAAWRMPRPEPLLRAGRRPPVQHACCRGQQPQHPPPPPRPARAAARHQHGQGQPGPWVTAVAPAPLPLRAGVSELEGAWETGFQSLGSWAGAPVQSSAGQKGERQKEREKETLFYFGAKVSTLNTLLITLSA